MSNEQLNLFPVPDDNAPVFDATAYAEEIAASSDTPVRRKHAHDVRNREAKREGVDAPIEEFMTEEEKAAASHEDSERSAMPEELKRIAQEMKGGYRDPARLGGTAVYNAYLHRRG